MTTFLDANGLRNAVASKIAEARRYADREGFEYSTLCLPKRDTDMLLAALAAEAENTRLRAQLAGATEGLGALLGEFHEDSDAHRAIAATLAALTPNEKDHPHG